MVSQRPNIATDRDAVKLREFREGDTEELALLIWLVSSWVRRSTPNATDKTALDILKERYARGEIGQDEFEQKRRDIGDSSNQ